MLKIHEIFCENPRIIFVLFYDVHKENMFTINLEDGRRVEWNDKVISQPLLYPEYGIIRLSVNLCYTLNRK